MDKITNYLLILIALMLVFVAFNQIYSKPDIIYIDDDGRRGGYFMYPGGMYRGTPITYISEYESNGEKIYYTGINENEQRIPTSYGPHWLYVHGGSCVDCHGIDGKGGFQVMMGYEIPSDIRYVSLTSDIRSEDAHVEHPPYTDETIKRAITEGIDSSNNVLDYTMPRWQMSDEDLDDLIEYLKKI